MLFMPRFRVIVVAALLGLTACQADVLTEPESSSNPSPREEIGSSGEQPDHLLGLPLFSPGGGSGKDKGKDKDGLELVRVKKGATLTAADAVLTLLPGSLKEAVDITIVPETTGYVSFIFGPSGLKFLQPPILAISTKKADLRGIDPRTLRIAGASDDKDDWEIVGGVYDPITKTVVAPILHFSRYALVTP